MEVIDSCFIKRGGLISTPTINKIGAIKKPDTLFWIQKRFTKITKIFLGGNMKKIITIFTVIVLAITMLLGTTGFASAHSGGNQDQHQEQHQGQYQKQHEDRHDNRDNRHSNRNHDKHQDGEDEYQDPIIEPIPDPIIVPDPIIEPTPDPIVDPIADPLPVLSVSMVSSKGEYITGEDIYFTVIATAPLNMPDIWSNYNEEIFMGVSELTVTQDAEGNYIYTGTMSYTVSDPPPTQGQHTAYLDVYDPATDSYTTIATTNFTITP
jgi:Ni/Co efflux regulator RcnB